MIIRVGWLFLQVLWYFGGAKDMWRLSGFSRWGEQCGWTKILCEIIDRCEITKQIKVTAQELCQNGVEEENPLPIPGWTSLSPHFSARGTGRCVAQQRTALSGRHEWKHFFSEYKNAATVLANSQIVFFPFFRKPFPFWQHMRRSWNETNFLFLSRLELRSAVYDSHFFFICSSNSPR